MENKVLRCQDCFNRFVFTERQQKHFAENGWADPIRCPNCRAAKRRRESEINYAAIMESCTMRLHSKHGRGFFRKLGHY